MAVGQLPEWERVVGVGARFTTSNGCEVLLSSVTLWSDRLCLEYGYDITNRFGAEPDVRRGIVPTWSVTDDLGTQFQVFRSGQSGHSQDLFFGEAWFSPAVPAQARWLYVASPELLKPIEISILRDPA